MIQRDIIELDKAIRNLESYCKIREVMYLQKRLIPLEENKNQPIDVNGRFLVNKYNVNQSIISKSTIYLLNDLIILTKRTDNHEIEKFRINLDEFVFVPNYSASLMVFHYKRNFDVLKFSSAEIMKDLITNLDCYRQIMFNSNPRKNNALFVSENLLENKISIPKVIDSSCCKIKSLIISVSYGTYLTYDTNNNSLNAFPNVKNIHTYAKIICTEDCPYSHIYGGEKYPTPLEFVGEKFVELKPKPKNTDSSICLNNVDQYKEPDDGRMYHTCCSYKNYIVIYGGYKTEKKNRKKFTKDVHFVDVKTGQWFKSKTGYEQAPKPRYMHSAVVYKNVMIIHGGISCEDGSILDDTWSYNFIDGKWSKIDLSPKNNIVVPRFGHAAVMVNQFMFIIGGLTIYSKSLSEQKDTENYKEENECQKNLNINNNEEEEDLNSSDGENLSINPVSNNSFVGAPNCFSFDVEKCILFNVPVIGNFLPGLSMLSACYDDHNKQIIIFGGNYQKI